jgi:rod shape-determining protein MreC
MVQTVDPTMSIAILFSHPDFRASAMSADGSSYGIVYPHLGSGAQRYLLELRNVPFRTSLKPGALILTSGLGGSFPRGVPIGTVLQELRTAEGWTRTYLLRPTVSPASVAAVMILTSQRSAQGVGGVWASVASVDSAARRIAVAGDSLARQEALAEAAARRAALDSTARGDTTATDTTHPPIPTTGAPAAAPRTVPPVVRPRVRRDTTRAVRTAPLDTGLFSLPARTDTARARRDTIHPGRP